MNYVEIVRIRDTERGLASTAGMYLGKACSAAESGLSRIRDTARLYSHSADPVQSRFRKMEREKPAQLLLIITCAAFLMGLGTRYWRSH